MTDEATERHARLLGVVGTGAEPIDLRLGRFELAVWAVLQETGRAILAAESGANYPLSADTIDRLLAECLLPTTEEATDRG